ncbi:MAG: DUF1570 domain-containing protein [Pirellulaceae bacterium]
MLRTQLLILAVVVVAPIAARQSAIAQTVSLRVGSGVIEGKPLFWNEQEITLLSRDGQIQTFQPNSVTHYAKTSDQFSAVSQAELQGALLREFKGYDVSRTGKFLVVHPIGQRDVWADRFEQLYRDFTHYFSVRRIPIDEPYFPLVAVVFPSRAIYLQYAPKSMQNTLGFYDSKTNRIYLFDAARSEGRDWSVNAETIIHEAAHQTAFNVGIHRRFGAVPTWVAEGIGTLFERPGVWNSQEYRSLHDRVNWTQLGTYAERIKPEDSVSVLQELIQNDRLFQRNPDVAYAYAWALTFYLTEREPAAYANYLKRLYQRDSFVPYGHADRVRDFISAFGSDVKMLDIRMQRYLAELKPQP